MGDANTIFVRDLHLEMQVGIYAHEIGRMQTVIVQIELALDPSLRWVKDAIEETVSYDDVVAQARKISGTRHFHLLETFAEDLAAVLLGMAQARSVSIALEKPDAATSPLRVGITVSREK